jgi:hypothetical protein
MFAAILSSQYFPFFLVADPRLNLASAPHASWPCQKQPFTNSAVSGRLPRITKSGVPMIS